MKKQLLSIFFATFFCSFYAQNKSEIAKVYINRANNAIEESIDYKEALELFEKAMKYMDTVTKPSVADLGAKIYFELENYRQAQKYSKQYFLLAKNKNSETYQQQLELFVTIDEKLKEQIERERILEEERIKKSKELKRIDSLKSIWKKTSTDMALKVDSVYNFNANNYALFSKEGKFGVINDKAEIILEAKEYTNAINFAGYFLLLNKSKEATKIYSFNTNSGTGILLPNPSDFNALSTHFGKVMLPRENGRLITYPNNSYEPLVFDLNQGKIVRISNKEDLMKDLKKNDVLRKYNKDGEVKVDKDWYLFGGHLGGGIYPLYVEGDYNVKAFLCSVDGTMLYADSKYDYIGSFHDNKAQAVKGDTISWVNQNGTKVSNAKDSKANYKGDSKVFKVEDGVYQILKNGVIINGDKKLEKLPEYLRKFQ
ncbi:hypothetical protein BXQ17_08335 [Polaribacter sp. BM10]|uniref:hypothetical protein n=1 Tax=Polaribacter sp. BM10 TaxID=1529069 RepID=UPI00098AA943|nr:hypothetical protein [Polaribacter sp. BM10]AQS94071.1 hypothetical protein BXQ17_08335 [Polaribacter sp. BM10]